MRAHQACRQLAGIDQPHHRRARHTQHRSCLLGGEVIRRTQHQRPFTVSRRSEHLGQRGRDRLGKIENGPISGAHLRATTGAFERHPDPIAFIARQQTHDPHPTHKRNKRTKEKVSGAQGGGGVDGHQMSVLAAKLSGSM